MSAVVSAVGSAYWCENAWLPAGVATSVRIETVDGRIAAVHTGAVPQDGDQRLTGLVLPGFANAHSHAFHRALRGRTHDGGGTFWSWRRQMYAVAGRLDPDSMLTLARAVYAEMALAGVTCVGEFHYLHHAPGGARYDDPNAMGHALVQAAADAGIRLTLLDTCYLAGGLGAGGYAPLDTEQQRFGDGDADGWASRVSALRAGTQAGDGTLDANPHARAGAAIHSVRAVPRDQLATVAVAAAEASPDGWPLHVHLSEQPAENQACQQAHGSTPAQLLHQHGALGPRTTAVHAVHLTEDDIDLLGGAGTGVCACPSTEADLADGIGPFAALVAAGSSLCLGSDQHAAVDLLGEAQRLELHERLRSGERGRFAPASLVRALTVAGHSALGWQDAGALEPGQRADLVAIRLDSPRTAGSLVAQAPLSAAAPDVHTVVVDGKPVVTDGVHRLGDVGSLLTAAIAPLWEDP